MLKKYFLFFLSFVPIIVSAQSWDWVKNYGTSSPVLVHQGKSISRDNQNNLYVTGYTWQPGGGGSSGWTYNWLKKFDPQGNLFWSDTIPFYTPETKNTTDKVGNTYVAGNGKIVKYNTNGIQQWAISTPIDFKDLALSDHGVVVIGFTWSNSATLGSYNIPAETGVVLECDVNGNVLWLNKHNKFGPGAVNVASNGIVYVQGLPFDGQDSSVVRLFDANGNYFKGLLNTKHVHPLITTDKQNSIYLIVGIRDYSPLIINSDTIRCDCGNSSNQVIVKFDSIGNYQWHKIIKDNVDVASLAVDSEDNVYVGGNIIRTLQIDSFLLDNKVQSLYVAKFNPNGAVVWIKYSDQVSSSGSGQLSDMILDSDNNTLITGAITDKHIFGDITITGHNNIYSDVLIAKIRQPRSVTNNQAQIVQSGNGLSLYPNPTNGIFIISYSAEDTNDLSLNVINYLGQTILSKQYSQKKQLNENLDLSRIAKGVYFVQVKSEQGTEVKKIVIQ